ncbi:4-hydroxy-tetrahydrodipicolinate synthase [Caballeronia sp. LZ035]|uniref:4-hydroxy-tetrahydrodipicolinate synthase n=1 Tax=Caballeronia sp. LZ035 TaxID=3038568 RepID=UPI0028591318|nr:4-hydroxy-tetrahydrodipicolinate synthase [Caballeronia sp. LZ035]MDR5763345.1 4-hydroxy-tetrahydrodipicolinate synthase [Caballeronia sp. LZ035]
MLTAHALRGIFSVIPSPVDENDCIDEQAARQLIRYLLGQGVDGFLALGGTGEYGGLSQRERVRMIETTASEAAGRVPVIAGVLDPGYHDAIESGKELAAAGADALLVLTPYYTNPTQAGIRDYFLRYAEASPLPIMIYEIPYRTRVAIDPAVLHELSKHENIIGMKACNTDMWHFLQTVAGVDAAFSVLSGEDSLFPMHVAAGARGGMLVTAAYLPTAWQRIWRLADERKIDDALALHRTLIPLMQLMFAECNPGPLKTVLDVLGIDSTRVLAPLVNSAPDLTARLREELVRQLDIFETAR